MIIQDYSIYTLRHLILMEFAYTATQECYGSISILVDITIPSGFDCRNAFTWPCAAGLELMRCWNLRLGMYLVYLHPPTIGATAYVSLGSSSSGEQLCLKVQYVVRGVE